MNSAPRIEIRRVSALLKNEGLLLLTNRVVTGPFEKQAPGACFNKHDKRPTWGCFNKHDGCPTGRRTILHNPSCL